MNNMEQIVNRPIFFERNRVRRIYRGGALYADFFGDDSRDGFYPEEWIASSVMALNDDEGHVKTEHEGISKVRGSGILFSELMKAYPGELFGNRNDAGILVKILDSAIRLPVQSHPDKAFAETHFHSPYGKAESWVILGTRENACIYYGFSKEITKDQFRDAVKKSAFQKDAMVPLLNRVPVKVGDVFLIAPKTVHAIGAGCLILETQEPTDFTIQPERYCGSHKLSEQEMYLGLDEETALDCFDYSQWGDHSVCHARQIPFTTFESDGILEETLISYDATPCFSVKRLTLERNSFDRIPHASVCVIVEGEGYIRWNNGEAAIKKGDYCFIPHAVSNIELSGSLKAVFCLPPKQ